VGHAGVEDFGDVGVFHHRECLALGFEPDDDLSAVHARLDDLEGDAPFDRLALLRHPDFAEAALADPFEEFVAANYLSGAFRGWRSGFEGPFLLQCGTSEETIVG